MTRKLGLFLLIGTLLAAGNASAETLRDAAQRFATAYASGDVTGLANVWSGDPWLVQVTAIKLRLKCVDFVAAEVTAVDDATRVARVTVKWWESPRDGSTPPKLVIRHPVVTFEQHDGRFVVTKYVVAEAALADQLIANPENAAATLNANSDLITADLVFVLSIRTADFAQRGDLKKAELAAHVMDDVVSLFADSEVTSFSKSVWASVKGRAGDVKNQLAFAQAALALADRTHEPDVTLRALLELGHAYERIPGNDEDAEKAYDRGRSLAAVVEDHSVLGHIYTSATAIRVRRGDTIGALARAKESAALFTEDHDDRGMATVEQALAVLLVNQGSDQLAKLHALRGLDAATRAKDESLRSFFLMVLAHVDILTGSDAEAQTYLKEAMAIAQRMNDLQTIGDCQRVSGMAHVFKHEYAEGIRDFEASIKSLKAAARPRLAQISSVALTRAKLESGDARGALEIGEATANATRQLGQHAEFVEVRELTGRAHHLLGENDKALADFNEAIEDAEVRRAWIAGDPGTQERAFETASVGYRLAAELLADVGRLDEAFTMAERAKARVLLDTLRSGRERIDEVMTPDERRSDKQFATRIAALNRRMAQETAKPSRDAAAIAKLTSELHDVRDEYETFAMTLYGAHTRLRQTRGDVPIATRADVEKILDAHSAIVMYQVMEHKTIVLLLTQKDIKRFDVNLDRDALAKRVVNYTSALANRDLGYRDSSRALYDLLMRPMESALAGVKVLCIIPDDVLWQVPFESLVDRRGKFVIESRACFYTQSVSVLAETMRSPQAHPAPQALLAVGNPKITSATRTQSAAIYRDASLQPLPHAEEEVRALRALYPKAASRIYTGKAANETAVKSDVSQYRILHFATHAEFNNENPLYAHIVLAQSEGSNEDGLLEAWEIMRMNLHADIAVLSACETARGRVASGEGIIGFSWALFVAGCPSSVVSHWKVNSESTAKLMVDFHRHLLSGRGAFSRAAALRQAKLDMLRTNRWAHPFYWSAFVLIGRS